MSAVVEARGLGVSLGGRPILRDVDLAVPAGQTVAVLGANGSGKSTLVRTLVGLHRPTAGQVLLFGGPVGHGRHGTAWERVGYVPQRSSIAQGVPATVAEVVMAGRVSRRTPFLPARRADREAVRRAIATVGLTERAAHTVSTLSGGQQQRVLVARTLAGEPDLLVLDEPNAGVDHGSQQEIADALHGLSEHGSTMLLVLHELGPFAPLIDRVLVMNEGRLVHDGPPDSLPDGLGGASGHDGHHLDPPRVWPTPPLPDPTALTGLTDRRRTR